MGVVIYGSRSYGRVDEYGGEYAQTRFFHIDFVPLIPQSSFWVTQERGDERVGFPIKLHLKSVVATYLRVWGTVAAIIAFAAAPGVLGVVLGAAFAALSAWSWTWRSVRGKRAQLRSDFHAVALGIRCDPQHLTDDMRGSIRDTLRARWDAHNSGRSPDEVARHGSKDVLEGVLAYGLLRLAEVDRGRAGGEERAAAERLLDGAHEPLPVEAGPYRSGASGDVAAPLSTAAATVARMAAEAAAARPALRAAPARRRWRHSPRAQLVGLVLLTMFGIGGAVMAWDALGPPHAVTARQLDSIDIGRERRVVVQVDEVMDPGWQIVRADRTDDPTMRVVLGRMGKHVLPIVIGAYDEAPGLRVVGRLRAVTHILRREPWLEALQADPKLDAAAFDYYLDLTRSHDTNVEGAIGLAIAAGTIVLWVLWLRAWRARRRARKAA